MSDRDINDPRWKAARYATFVRDSFKCVLCFKGGDLECHHIIPWAVSEKLRFVMSNLVTLCVPCHLKVTGNEDHYIDQFKKIVAFKTSERKKEYYKKNGRWKYKPGNPFLR